MTLEQVRQEVLERIKNEIPSAFRWFPGAEMLIITLINAVIKVLIPLLKDKKQAFNYGVEIPDSLLDTVADMAIKFLKIDPAQSVLWRGIIKLAIKYLLETLTGPKQHIAFATAQGFGESLLVTVEKLAAELPGE